MPFAGSRHRRLTSFIWNTTSLRRLPCATSRPPRLGAADTSRYWVALIGLRRCSASSGTGPPPGREPYGLSAVVARMCPTFKATRTPRRELAGGLFAGLLLGVGHLLAARARAARSGLVARPLAVVSTPLEPALRLGSAFLIDCGLADHAVELSGGWGATSYPGCYPTALAPPSGAPLVEAFARPSRGPLRHCHPDRAIR